MNKIADQYYMQQCLELAKKALGETYPNPMVGAVIVYGVKISEATGNNPKENLINP